ncbi:hypothetical protein [uncultured Draconibacterium sp.]|uniref:hypothetical protein n=1 Tax=uncultured Draconibacterium sp. TaxID=1573823 RepID=UPI0025FBC188|nr:hypothetical protein [uncultured Draconibacterium sp.]
MNNSVKILTITILLGWLITGSATFVFAQNYGSTSQQVKVFHPALHPVEKTDVNLYQQNGTSKNRFYIEVESVSCGDNQCHVVPVRMYFNKLGFFEKLEFGRGVRLEKTKGKRFRKADYQKLNAILKKQDSELARVDKEQLVKKQTDLDGVDAISGATTPLLPDKSYVKGAVWTCYTLWHWANGELVQIIRNKTGEETTVPAFVTLLKSDNQINRLFALEQIERLSKYQSELLSCIQQQANTFSRQETKLLLKYLENAPDSIRFSSLLELVVNNRQMQYDGLTSILKLMRDLSETECVQLSKLFSVLEFYPELNLLLTIFEKSKCDHTEIVDEVLLLLNRENIIIGRRAYWFLIERNLTLNQRKTLEEYRLENSEYF